MGEDKIWEGIITRRRIARTFTNKVKVHIPTNWVLSKFQEILLLTRSKSIPGYR